MREGIIKSIGWIILVSSVLAGLASIEGSIALGERVIKGPIFPLPSWIVWGLCLVSIAYISWLKYVEFRNEKLLRIVRSNLIKSIEHLDSLLRLVGNKLANQGGVGRLAKLSLEDANRTYSLPLSGLRNAAEGKGGRFKLLPHKVENNFISVLNSYEIAVYRLRDAGNCVNFDFHENGNYKEWKRFDTELLKEVKTLISDSSTQTIRNSLGNSVWKNGVRNYL